MSTRHCVLPIDQGLSLCRCPWNLAVTMFTIQSDKLVETLADSLPCGCETHSLTATRFVRSPDNPFRARLRAGASSHLRLLAA